MAVTTCQIYLECAQLHDLERAQLHDLIVRRMSSICILLYLDTDWRNQIGAFTLSEWYYARHLKCSV